MRLESRSLLHDIWLAIERIEAFIQGASFDDYLLNEMMRSAVERQFGIAGDALARLSADDPDLAWRINARPRIISFRNRLIHGYFAVDDRLVWDVIQTHLPVLRRDVEKLLQEE